MATSEVRQRKAKKAEASTAADQIPQSAAVSTQERWRSYWTRFYSTLIMIFTFILLLYLGHLAMVVLIIFLQVMVFKEIMDIRKQKFKKKLTEADENEVVPISQLVDAWFFFMAVYYIHGQVIISRYRNNLLLTRNEILIYMATHHSFISFCLFISGFVFFVLTLRKGKLKLQFRQLAWTIITLVAISYPVDFHVNNIYEGLFWFFFPCSLVVCNDIMAYLWGISFGKTPLIELSPKKTWEGFVGGFFSTLVIGFIGARILASFDYLVCPRTDLFAASATCQRHPVFIMTNYTLSTELSSLLAKVGISLASVSIYPVQLHALVLATVASLIAPFGGFFASGFKRALKIKDFGESIPGHGGITDRIDCQFIMGGCSYIYYITFVAYNSLTASHVLTKALLLPPDKQVELYRELHNYLSGKGLI